MLYDTIQYKEFNVVSKDECAQLNLAHETKTHSDQIVQYENSTLGLMILLQ